MKSKLWTVYQVENQINSRLYIGVHKTVDPNDDYMGSGKLIKRAIQKHGVENFKKIILLATENKDEAYSLERELVTLDRIESGELYNLKEGGEGGWDFANKIADSATKSNRGIIGNNVRRQLRVENPELSKRDSIKAREASIKRNSAQYLPKNLMLGRKHSAETITKMKLSSVGLQIGTKNSRFGSVWVTNGIESKSLTKDQAELLISQGWVRGRKLQGSLASLVSAAVC